MAATKRVYQCSACGQTQPKWGGKCDGCGAWNTLTETAQSPLVQKAQSSASAFSGLGNGLTPIDLRARVNPPPRVATGNPEFDRVLGGGLVEGSVVLLAGDPGAGKSTLLMQTLTHLANTGIPVLYASGEESADQIQLRAQRLGVTDSPLQLVTSNDAQGIAGLMERMPKGAIIAIDSVQAMDAGADSSPGSVAQVKATASLFTPLAKTRGITTLLVNHVTKEGSFAGPQLLRHAVDVSLMLQNDTSQGYMRVLRADKNRFGADDEIGLFDMGEDGLKPITNPSAFFMEQRAAGAFGTVIFPSLEGTRPMLVEVQALVAPSAFGTGRRQSTGWDTARMNMILAMLTTRLGLTMADKDVYVNVAGGLKISDPGMDAAVVLALLSAYFQRAVKDTVAVFGEVGLAGEMRGVVRPESRLREATSLGFQTIVCPTLRNGTPKGVQGNIMAFDRVARFLEHIDTLLD
jgi:DNA repair protein RadA/Sms